MPYSLNCRWIVEKVISGQDVEGIACFANFYRLILQTHFRLNKLQKKKFIIIKVKYFGHLFCNNRDKRLVMIQSFFSWICRNKAGVSILENDWNLTILWTVKLAKVLIEGHRHQFAIFKKLFLIWVLSVGIDIPKIQQALAKVFQGGDISDFSIWPCECVHYSCTVQCWCTNKWLSFSLLCLSVVLQKFKF